MVDTPDLDKARETVEKFCSDPASVYWSREEWIDYLVEQLLEQRAEEAERCADFVGSEGLKERAEYLRQQARSIISI